MVLPKINLHIHSYYSDGTNSIKQIVKKALNLDLDYIAITDHFTNSWKANLIPTLNSFDKISEYLDDISNFQDYLKENNKKLVLYKGIEVDLSSSERYIKRFIQISQFDLVLFEYLQTPESIAFIKNIIRYWKNSISNRDKFPILGLAHFDPSYFLHGNLEILIQFLKDYNLYFEFNSSYPQYYSSKNALFFKKLKQHNIPVAIGCDSHNLLNLNDIEEPLEMIKYYGLENNYKLLISILKNFL